MTLNITDTASRSRGSIRPRFAIQFPPSPMEGAGKTGCALHPRSRVHVVREMRTRAYRSSGEHPAFPAQGRVWGSKTQTKQCVAVVASMFASRSAEALNCCAKLPDGPG